MAKAYVHTFDNLSKPYKIEAIGQVLMAGQQRYVCEQIRPVRCSDGSHSKIADLRSECATCGAQFTFSTGLTGAKFYPNRRCDRHKRKGKAAFAPSLALKSKADKLETQVSELKLKLKQAEAKAKAEQRRADAAERSLARYELNGKERSAFDALCAQQAAERRAKLRRAAKRGPELSAFG